MNNAKKVTINTFSSGLMSDLSEVSTPAGALTGCLNGTLITYNGNESTLLNDIGNAQVGTSYLPKGYVPVGTAEDGGIIYVASYNPETKHGQIGSFPSPKLLYTNSDINISEVSINFTDFIDFKLDQNENNVPIITQDIKRYNLFQIKTLQNEESGTYKILHPGDKFIILANIDTDKKDILFKCIEDKILNIHLAIISKGGEIEYIDNNSLKLYKLSSLNISIETFLLFKNLKIENILKDYPEYILVYSGKTSGRLMLIVEFLVFESFNLMRSYFMDLNNEIAVKFTGNAKKFKFNNINNSNTICNFNLDGNSVTVSEILELKGKNKIVNYDIAPVNSNYGVIKNLSKSGSINIDLLRKNQNNFRNWSFFIEDSSIIINWSYDYFNIDESEKIKFIRFYFIPIENIDKLPEDLLKGVRYEDFIKESYNGDFEDIVSFESEDMENLYKNHIYICKIVKFTYNSKETSEDSNKETDIAYRYLYTGTFYNDKTQTIESNNRPLISVPVTYNINKKENLNLELYRNSNWSSTSSTLEKIETKNLNSALFIINNLNSEDYKFETFKKGNYTHNLKINPAFDTKNYMYKNKNYKLSDFAGNINLSELLSSTSLNINDIQGLLIHEEPIFSTNLNNLNNDIIKILNTKNVSLEKISSLDAVEYNIYSHIYRGINATPSNPITKTVSLERLAPIYENENDFYNNKLFSFTNKGTNLICVTGDKENICFNSEVLWTEHTDRNHIGTSVGGTLNVKGPALNQALKIMGDLTIGIFGGHADDKDADGDTASFRINGDYVRSNYWWGRMDYREIDRRDNFLIATWKDTNNEHHLINLATPKNPAKKFRVDSLLKLILSQLLISKVTPTKKTFKCPDKDNYSYTMPYESEICLNISNSITNINFNINYTDNSGNTVSKTIEEYITEWEEKYPQLNKYNFLPIFKYNDKEYSYVLKFGKEISMDTAPNIIQYYLNGSNFEDFGNLGYDSQLQDMENKTNFKFNAADTIDINYLRTYIFKGEVLRVNSDGQCVLKIHDDGSPVVQSIAGSNINDDTLTLACPRYLTKADTDITVIDNTDIIQMSIDCNINKIFITTLRNNNWIYNDLTADMYNEVLLMTGVEETDTEWVAGHDLAGPNFTRGIQFGDISLIKNKA